VRPALDVLLLPVGGLAILFAAGVGVADALGRRLPLQARAALAAPLSAALLTTASPLAQLGLRPSYVGIAVVGALVAVTLVRLREVGLVVRRAGAPLVVAVVALALSGAPAITHGTSAVAGFGNGDPYLWVSQARALASGPVPSPAGLHPDRVAYDKISVDHSPIGLPVGLAQIAAIGDDDPIDVYEAFSSMIFALLAVGTFFVARGCLHWRPAVATAAAFIVSSNGYLLFASYYGWQAQLSLTMFGLLAVMTLLACLDRKALRRESLLPATFAAAGVATYGWLLGIFAGLALVATLVSSVGQIRSAPGRRRFVWTLVTVAGLALILGLVPAVNAVRALLGSTGNGEANAAELASWSHYSWGFPSDALGLIARQIDLKTPGADWVGLSLVVTVALLATAAARMPAFRNPRGYALAGVCAALLVGLSILGLKGSSPYLSMKLMGYGAPFFTLFVLSIFVPRRRRPRKTTVLAITAGVLFCLTTLISLTQGVRSTERTTALAGAAGATARLPGRSVIRIDYSDVWHQVWLIYFLRDRRLSVPNPTIYLTDVGYGGKDPPRFNTPAAYAIGPKARGPVIWHKDGMFLYSLR
jgi:hypothetical protein